MFYSYTGNVYNSTTVPLDMTKWCSLSTKLSMPDLYSRPPKENPVRGLRSSTIGPCIDVTNIPIAGCRVRAGNDKKLRV